MNETMAGLIVLCFSVLLVYLLWCVWRPEGRVEDTRGALVDRPDMSLENQLQAIRNGVLDQYNMIHSLARALGYEWKRTDAKEGWERCAVASVKPDAPKNSVPAGVVYGAPYFGCPPIRYFEAMDRRKADRRKPALTYTANAQGADGKVRKVSSKKRRAH